MYSGDNTCRKKILFICSFFLSVLLSFVCALRPLAANALAPDDYKIYYNFYGSNNNEYDWSGKHVAGYTYSASNVRRYEWVINSINFTGNYATIHFETNIVRHDIGYFTGRFTNLDNLYVWYCGTGGQNGTIQSYSISTAKTVWYSSNNTIENETLTVYGDVVVSGLQYSSGTHDIYCAVSTQDGNPFITSPNAGLESLNLSVSIEQSPTSVVFSNNLADALNTDRNNILNNIDNSINYYNDSEQQRWETERQEQADKEDELNDQADGLSLSASNLSNPFLSLFGSSVSSFGSCYRTQSLHALFNSSSWLICPPFVNATAGVKNAISFVSNAFVVVLLIRLYYKKLKGGVDG